MVSPRCKRLANNGLLSGGIVSFWNSFSSSGSGLKFSIAKTLD